MLNFSSELEYEDDDIILEDDWKTKGVKNGNKVSEVYPDPYEKPKEDLTPFDIFLWEHTV